MNLCERCHRPLKMEKSILDGLGPVCKKKQEIEDERAKKQLLFLDKTQEGKLAKQFL